MTNATPAPVRPTNGLAIGALISAFFIPLLGAILGHVSLSQIKKTGDNGKGLAIAAVVIGWVGTVIYGLVILFTVILAGATIQATDEVLTDLETAPVFAEYDLEANPDDLYPNGVYGDDDQDGALSEDETYAEKGAEGYLKDEDLDKSGAVSWYESEKYFYDLSNS